MKICKILPIAPPVKEGLLGWESRATKRLRLQLPTGTIRPLPLTAARSVGIIGSVGPLPVGPIESIHPDDDQDAALNAAASSHSPPVGPIEPIIAAA